MDFDRAVLLATVEEHAKTSSGFIPTVVLNHPLASAIIYPTTIVNSFQKKCHGLDRTLHVA